MWGVKGWEGWQRVGQLLRGKSGWVLATRDLLSLGRGMMLSQDTSLVAGAHELVVDAEEAIWAIQQKVRATLRRLGTASDISETGSVDLSGQDEVPARREVPVDRNIQPVVSAISRQTLMAGKPGNEVADLIRCLSGAQATDSGWPLFTGKYRM
jgi:hypothetical protein